ncbi:hypothetical protein [Nocardioides terrisoli]|uniref:hypothetical protein n=1 Tax=Nocardioides terrisoli TaxID=3388267 RepID=UPI00287BBBB9|nr:hypothetical protein [Nocardioides marmorisolisilvae]
MDGVVVMVKASRAVAGRRNAWESRANRVARGPAAMGPDPAEVLRQRRVGLGRRTARRALRTRDRLAVAISAAEREAGRALRGLCGEGLSLAAAAREVGISRDLARRLVRAEDPSTDPRALPVSTAPGAECASGRFGVDGRGVGARGGLGAVDQGGR